MGRKENNKKIKKHQQPSESQHQEQELSNQEQEDFDNAQYDQEFDGQQVDGDQILLQHIQNKIQQVDDQEKLSWAAIYQVKKQQAQLNDQMQKQIDAIKQKYQIQRLPLMHKVAQAVSGKKLDKSLYSQNQFVKSINLNKTKPKAIKDYWSKVFDGCGLIAHQDDVEIFQKMTSFRCQLLDTQTQNYKLNFQFEDNEYLGNSLSVQVKGNVADGSFTKKLEFTPKGKQINENAILGVFTRSDVEDQQLCDVCLDFYRAYVSSTYFYFHEPSDDLGLQDGQQDDEGENDQEDEDQDEDEVKAVQKPKGSAITQKPQCKQQ